MGSRPGWPPTATMIRTGSFDQLDARAGNVVAEALLLVGVVGHPSGVLQRGRQINLRAWSLQPERWPGPGIPHQPGGAGEGADRRRTTVDTGPPEPVGLDQNDLGTKLSPLQGRVQAGRPATENQQPHAPSTKVPGRTAGRGRVWRCQLVLSSCV